MLRKPITRRLSAVLFLALASFAQTLVAADHYATPQGAGTMDGTSWADALPQAGIETTLNAMPAGDTLYLGSGSYTLASLQITSSGTAGSPKALIGVDTGSGLPVFQGTFDVHNAAGSTFLLFPDAASHWELKNLRFRNQPFAITLRRSGTTDTLRTNLTFENLHFDSVEDAIRLYNASDILVKDCTVVRYTKKAFRIGDYTSFVVFDTCFADCNEGDPTFPSRSIPNGFALDDTDGEPTIHDITFQDCVAMNNGFAQGSSVYWNGDGFSSERGAYNITFLRCKSYNNMDGGFDNKASYITYQDCVASGNLRGFRHWADNGVMFNCVSTNNSANGGTGSPYGIWVSGSGGVLNIDFSTVHNGVPGIAIENGGVVTVSNSILSTTSATAAFASASATLIDTATYRPGQGTDPQYVLLDPNWQGTPVDAMDSQTYGTTKGYHSSRVDETPNVAPTLTIAASTTSGVAPVEVTFTATANDPDGTVISHLWDFGDGQVSNEPNPSHTYDVPGEYLVTCNITDNRGARVGESLSITVSVPTVPQVVRIESGNTTAYTDVNGQSWAPDHSYGAGGGIADRGAIAIAGTADDRIYQTERWGVTGYSILLANGIYEVKLHFAETYTGITAAGQRVFTVYGEDTIPAGWSDIDVFAQAGGSNTALVKSGFVEVTDNTLDLVFAASADNPMISGLEILPAAGGDLPPTPPTIFSVSDRQSYSFTVAWSGATDSSGIADYEVYLDGALQGIATAATYTFTGLAPYTPYQVSVRARDTAGNLSARSNSFEVKTLDDGTAGNDIIVDNSDVFGATVVGAWTASSATTGYEGADYLHNQNTGAGQKSVTFTPDLPSAGSFEVFLRWTSGSNRASNVPVDIVHAGVTTTVTVNQRANGATWYSLGTYALSAGVVNSVTLRTDGTNGFVIADAVRFVAATGPGPDVEAPSVPQNLQATAVTTDAFTAGWTASTDNVGVEDYEVYLDGVLHGTTTGTSLSFVGLTPATTYSVTVVATDAAGNASAASTPLVVTTANTGGGGGPVASGVISLNTASAGTELVSTDIAGAVPAAWWNNSTVNNEVLTNVVDSDGNATTVDFVFANTPYGYDNATAALAAPLDDDAKMMRGQRARSNEGRMAVAAQNIPYATYDVYVYWGGRKVSETVPSTMAVNLQLWNGSAWVIQDTKFIRDDDRAWDGTYDESTATTAAAATDGNEYVVFRSLTANTFRILTEGGVRSGLSGLQIVAEASAEPEANAPAITSADSAGGTYGEPFSYQIVATESPTTYAATGLPAGLTLDPVTGLISGTLNAAGLHAIQLGASNQTGTGTATLSLQVAPAGQTIAFPAPTAKTFGDAPFPLSATASSGLPVVYSVVSGPVSLDSATVTLTGAGTVEIVASQPGTANYLPAASQSIRFEVLPLSIDLSIARLWQFYDGSPKPVDVASAFGDIALHVTYNGSTEPPIYPGAYAVEATVLENGLVGTVAGILEIATTVVSRHAPNLNGRLTGSALVLSADGFSLNSNARISGDVLVPGSPSVRVNGSPLFLGVVDSSGAETPANYRVTVNSGASLRNLVRRVDPITLPDVSAPAAPAGTVNVSLNHASDQVGDFSSLLNLTLNSGVGVRSLPAGTYGHLTVNGGNTLILGDAASADPTSYDLQRLTLNSGSQVQLVGPVVLTLGGSTVLNGPLGNPDHPEWLLLRIASGNLTLNSSGTVHGFIEAPSGTVTVNHSATLVGAVSADRVVLNGGAISTPESP